MEDEFVYDAQESYNEASAEKQKAFDLLYAIVMESYTAYCNMPELCNKFGLTMGNMINFQGKSNE